MCFFLLLIYIKIQFFNNIESEFEMKRSYYFYILLMIVVFIFNLSCSKKESKKDEQDSVKQSSLSKKEEKKLARKRMKKYHKASTSIVMEANLFSKNFKKFVFTYSNETKSEWLIEYKKGIQKFKKIISKFEKIPVQKSSEIENIRKTDIGFLNCNLKLFEKYKKQVDEGITPVNDEKVKKIQKKCNDFYVEYNKLVREYYKKYSRKRYKRKKRKRRKKRRKKRKY